MSTRESSRPWALRGPKDRKFKATEICVPACDIGAVRLVRRIRCPTKHFSFCGVNRRVSKPRAGKAARAGKRRVLWFFPVFTKSPCPSRNCSQLLRVRRRVGTGDGRMDPRARLRITGAVHRRGRVRGWRGLARVAVPTRGACEPFVPSGADQTVPLTTLSSQGKPWWWGLCGSVVLVVYGFIPCLQPMSDFGRVYAVYGGFFIALSYLWGEHPRRRNPKSKTHPHHPTDSPPPNSSPQGTDWTDSSPTWVTWSGVRCA